MMKLSKKQEKDLSTRAIFVINKVLEEYGWDWKGKDSVPTLVTISKYAGEILKVKGCGRKTYFEIAKWLYDNNRISSMDMWRKPNRYIPFTSRIPKDLKEI